MIIVLFKQFSFIIKNERLLNIVLKVLNSDLCLNRSLVQISLILLFIINQTQGRINQN